MPSEGSAHPSLHLPPLAGRQADRRSQTALSLMKGRKPRVKDVGAMSWEEADVSDDSNLPC